jgi:outer membrane murein-binding lipoprotein Lpp
MQYSHMSLTERRKAIAKAVKAAKNEAATVIQRAVRKHQTRKAKKGGRHRRTHRKV